MVAIIGKINQMGLIIPLIWMFYFSDVWRFEEREKKWQKIISCKKMKSRNFINWVLLIE